MVWRRLQPGETNHELIWLLVTLGSAAFAWFVIHFGLTHPACVFKQLTGFPCPSCGATRCVRFALSGSLMSALLINPLAFLSFIAIGIYDLYAATVLLFRLPRLRWEKMPAFLGPLTRWGAITVFVANWTWLILRRV